MTKYPGFYPMLGQIERGAQVTLLGKPVTRFSNRIVAWCNLWLYEHEFAKLITHFEDRFVIKVNQ